MPFNFEELGYEQARDIVYERNADRLIKIEKEYDLSPPMTNVLIGTCAGVDVRIEPRTQRALVRRRLMDAAGGLTDKGRDVAERLGYEMYVFERDQAALAAQVAKYERTMPNPIDELRKRLESRDV